MTHLSSTDRISTRAGDIRSQGQARGWRTRGLVVTPVLLLAIGLNLWFGSTASAIVIRPEIANFGSDGTPGSTFPEGDGGTVLDHNTNKLFVPVGGTTSGVFGFDASGGLPFRRWTDSRPYGRRGRLATQILSAETLSEQGETK